MKLYAPFSHRVLVLIILSLMFASFAFAAADDIDTNFAPNIRNNLPQGSYYNYELQSDGKILVIAFYQDSSNVSRSILFRMNSDGSEDTTFNQNSNLSYINSVKVAPDGKILVDGKVGTPSALKLVRLNPDGSLDASFNYISNFICLDCSGRVVAVQPDKKVFGSRISTGFQLYLETIYRYNPDGSQDTTFTPLTFDYRNRNRFTKLVILPNGKLMFSGFQGQYGVLFRLNADGTKDTSFESPIISQAGCQFLCSPYISNFILKDNGKVIVTGYFDSINGLTTYP